MLCLVGPGLILLGTVEPVLGLGPAESLPGQHQEETELVRGRGSIVCQGRGPQAPCMALGHLEVLLLLLPRFGGWFWPCWGVEALQEVLGKLGSRELPALEKRLSWVPSCEPGEPCAVRKGARIGKLCSCPRGTACNLFILKCS
uniref:Uncharacterized protein n=1 Tax=Strigops habroptila TaxID=2489341 RepID=A0A672TWT3_STRHB